MNNRKLAALAGVSPSTVSKVFGGSKEISPETAERVRKIAEENGWTPPKYRKTARARNTLRVAILVPEIISVFYAQIVTDMVEKLRAEDIEPDIHITGFSRTDIDALLPRLVQDGLADGIIMVNAYQFLNDPGVPIVSYQEVGQPDGGSDAVFSVSDSYMERCVGYLRELGHEKIAFAGETLTFPKMHSFRHAMEREGLFVGNGNETEDGNQSGSIYTSEKRFEEAGYDAASFYIRQLREDPEAVLPTAFICAYDEVALGLIRAFKDAGLRVPEDVSVIGINNIAPSSYAGVPLTTVDTFSHARTALCVQMLIDKMRRKGPALTQKIEIHCELIVRSSTAPPPGELITGAHFRDIRP